jgi:hypothetical protein
MEHRGDFDAWWGEGRCCRDSCTVKYSQSELYAKFGIPKEEFEKYPFRNGFDKGDLMILISPKALKKGDIAVFTTATSGDPVIHRIIANTTVNGRAYITTKGDFNCDLHPFELEIPREAVLGKAAVRIPLLGWIKIGAVEGVNAIKNLL